jgi:hypothetical protein
MNRIWKEIPTCFNIKWCKNHRTIVTSVITHPLEIHTRNKSKKFRKQIVTDESEHSKPRLMEERGGRRRLGSRPPAGERPTGRQAGAPDLRYGQAVAGRIACTVADGQAVACLHGQGREARFLRRSPTSSTAASPLSTSSQLHLTGSRRSACLPTLAMPPPALTNEGNNSWVVTGELLRPLVGSKKKVGVLFAK